MFSLLILSLIVWNFLDIDESEEFNECAINMVPIIEFV